MTDHDDIDAVRDDADDTDAAIDSAGAEDDGELDHIPVVPDAYQVLADLLRLCADVRGSRARLRALRIGQGRLRDLRERLAQERAAFLEYERMTRAELDARAAKLREGEQHLADTRDARSDAIAAREQRIRELELACASLARTMTSQEASGRQNFRPC